MWQLTTRPRSFLCQFELPGTKTDFSDVSTRENVIVRPGAPGPSAWGEKSSIHLDRTDMKSDDVIRHNVKAHDRISDRYEQIHGEIFNPIEQQRLHNQLTQAIAYITTSSVQKRALDYGCGSGNLTRYLIELGLHVLSADVSENFLAVIKEKYGHTGLSETLRINGQDLADVDSNSCDFVSTYSVLHHVPDYLKILKEMIRVIRRGGILYLDHEQNESYWNPNVEYVEFLQALPKSPPKKLTRFLKLANYADTFRRMVNPRFQREGDIHVWRDDHIEWDAIESVLAAHGCTIVLKQDYLLYKRHYPENTYQVHKNTCSDMRVLIARKD